MPVSIGAPVITPEASNSVVIAVNMLGLGPPSGTLTPGVIFTSTWATGMTDATNWDSGDCYGYIYTTSTNPISFSWQMANSFSVPNGASAYDAAAIEILSAGAAATGPETLTVTNSPVVYNGSPQAAAVSASVPGTVSDVLYNSSSAVPTAPGTYAVTANFTPQNTAEYSTLTGASAGNFVISKATPTVTLSSSLNPSVRGEIGDVYRHCSFQCNGFGDVLRRSHHAWHGHTERRKRETLHLGAAGRVEFNHRCLWGRQQQQRGIVRHADSNGEFVGPNHANDYMACTRADQQWDRAERNAAGCQGIGAGNLCLFAAGADRARSWIADVDGNFYTH